MGQIYFRFVFAALSTIITAMVVVGFVHLLIFEPSEVNGRSMEPTLQDGQIIIIDKISLLTHLPRRGQLVSVYDEFDHLLQVKRIIGLPGETVLIHDDAVWIKPLGEPEYKLDEPYILGQITRPSEGFTSSSPVLGSYEYFLLGDHRKASVDSRRYGPVGRERIVGAVHAFPF